MKGVPQEERLLSNESQMNRKAPGEIAGCECTRSYERVARLIVAERKPRRADVEAAAVTAAFIGETGHRKIESPAVARVGLAGRRAVSAALILCGPVT